MNGEAIESELACLARSWLDQQATTLSDLGRPKSAYPATNLQLRSHSDTPDAEDKIRYQPHQSTVLKIPL